MQQENLSIKGEIFQIPQEQEFHETHGNKPNGFFARSNVSFEQIGVVTWIASVLFCSCVCLGNIGRRLAI